MAFLSENLSKIKPSPGLELQRLVTELKAAGKDVIGLGLGEPDFDTPDHIKEAGIRAIQDGQTKYTTVDGTIECKQAVALKFKRDNNLDFSTSQISVNSGTKQTIYNALVATLNPSDEVLIPAPYWMSYPDMVLLAGGVPAIVKTTIENSFKLQPAGLDAAITPNTKWLIMNSPSNPTGTAYSKDELAALGDVLRKHPRVHVMCDDIYEHLVYDGFEFSTFLNAAPDLAERVITINGVAKAYAMTGWRIGFAGGPEPLIKAMAKVQSQSTSNPCSISQAAAIAALTGPQEIVRERTAIFQGRRDKVLSMLGQATGVRCLRPDGAFYVYADVGPLIGKKTPGGQIIGNDKDFVKYLLEDKGVAVIPGEVFGLSPYFRLSYAASMETLEDACGRIQEATAALT
ncbi:MAG: pyridoxal phosphate-dependent aminotransferase [Proteobacteria bacterium]|nr:pyridoxal phosphate-dependent aminotransferase [Pseudomonadota bacterium]